MDMDQKPPIGSSGQPHPEIPRRRPTRQVHDTHGSLQEVIWAILFGCGMALIWAGKGIAGIFRLVKNLFLKKPSD
jgi:hypothetical protein